MKSLTASEFKTKCLQVINEVARTGMPVVITKNGEPVVQLAPIAPQSTTLVGAHRGKITVVGDILGPIDEDWEAGR